MKTRAPQNYNLYILLKIIFPMNVCENIALVLFFFNISSSRATQFEFYSIWLKTERVKKILLILVLLL